MHKKALAPQAPDWMQWQLSNKHRQGSLQQQQQGQVAMRDDPWTYKNNEEYTQYTPWTGGTPNPINDKEWREVLRSVEYTSLASRTALENEHERASTAGVRHRSANGELLHNLHKPRHDLTKPLALLQQQRNMVNDKLIGTLETATSKQAGDRHLRPNPIRRTVHDNSAASAKNRMKAMKAFRGLGPDKMFTISSAVFAAAFPEALTVQADGKGESVLPERLTFDMVSSLLFPDTTYYKLSHHDVPATEAHTASSFFPMGISNQGSVTAYGGGRLATGS